MRPEAHRQKKLVARSSVEAQAYLASRPPASSSSSAAPSAARAAPPAPTENNPPTTSTSLDALFGPSPPDPAPAPSPSAAAPAPAPEEKSAPAAPPRRRAGGGLAGMAASLGVGKKPAKLNTLEKSKLDWDRCGGRLLSLSPLSLLPALLSLLTRPGTEENVAR